MEWECTVIMYTVTQIFCQRWSFWNILGACDFPTEWLLIQTNVYFKKKKEVTKCFIDKENKSCLLTDCRLFLPRCNVRNARNRLASQTGMCSILLPVRFNTWRYIRFSRPSILVIRLYDRFRSFSFRHLSSFSILSIMLLLRLSCCSFFNLSRFSMYCKQDTFKLSTHFS